MTDYSTDETKRQQSYTITTLCRDFGVTPRTLRFYEQRKLLNPTRRGSTRIFSYRDRARLQLILRGKRFGFTLTEIKKILDLYDHDGGQLTQLQAALPKLEAQLEVLQQERDALGKTITDLGRFCIQIKEMLRERLETSTASSH